MADITIYCYLDSGANISSTRWTSFEVDEEDWNSMSDAEKEDMAKDVAWEKMDWGYTTEKPKRMYY